MTWDAITLKPQYLRKIIPEPLLWLKSIIFNRVDRSPASSRLSRENQANLRTLANELHPYSPLETIMTSLMPAEMRDLALLVDDPHHFFQLHIVCTATIAWILGMRYAGSEDEAIKKYIIACLDWLDHIPMTSQLAPSGEGDEISGQCVTVSLFVSHWWRELVEWNSDILFSENLDIFGNTCNNPGTSGELRELLLGMTLVGVERETLKLSVILLLSGLGLLMAGTQDAVVDKYCLRWLSPMIKTRWPEESMDASYPKDASERRVAQCNEAERASLYSVHQTCHWVLGLNHVGQGRLRLTNNELSTPEKVSLMLLASIPQTNYQNLCDNRPLPQLFRFLIVPLLRPVVSKVFEVVPPADCDQEYDPIINAFGPPDHWAEILMWGYQNTQGPSVMKPICLFGSNQSHDTLLGNWTTLQTLHLRSQYHLPMTLDRTSPLLNLQHSVPEMLFVQSAPTFGLQITHEPGKETSGKENKDTSGEELIPLITI
eukprot:Gregarina_sp_Poly_1__756@NODE_1180_length_4850_cov_64_390759_g810_i0_p2_GENE_NODE_1180_length_4850_cov_64_390759_g810_i0NODE_1180_length_4850_cov_64_390759_g810_i0_p2_ORF_typecomplete_len487_score41_76PC_rep/PF01851_22/44PC_rep/PF01851_22/6_4e03PC_rep/PF01851_22/2_8_NODE_1180_length_4850_cov_64_390759_g810_i08322292